MTENEAIEVLKDFNRCVRAKSDGAYETNDFIKAREMAINALEKQVAKKIIHEPMAGRDRDWRCPSCDSFASPYSNYCTNCGQHIDRSGLTEDD